MQGLRLTEWFSPAILKSKEYSHEAISEQIKQRIEDKAHHFAISITPQAFLRPWSQHEVLVDKIAWSLHDAGATHILLYREDFWGSCMSLYMALLTGKWHNSQTEKEDRQVRFLDVAQKRLNQETLVIDAFKRYAPDENSFLFSYEMLAASPMTFAFDLLRAVDPALSSFSMIKHELLERRVRDPLAFESIEPLLGLGDSEIELIYQLKKQRDLNVYKSIGELRQRVYV